jgi:ketosteroid isomerase-like protein
MQAPDGGAAEGNGTMTTTSSSTASTTTAGRTAEAEVRTVLEQYADAYARRDPEAIFGFFAGGAARYDLAPPLQQGPGTMVGDVAGVAAWLATFDGPVLFEHRDLEVAVGGDVAFAHALTRMTATPAGESQSFSFWLRSTYGLRLLDGRWRILHEHQSTPFHMDGSFRAATDLEP